MPDATFLVDRGHIDRFARALRQAVYDKALEQTETIRYYHDADVLAWPILGFQNFDSYLMEPTQKLLLVRALLSAGYLGTAYVLRPHALELDNLIRRAPSFSSPKARVGFRERVYAFLRSEGIEAEMTLLLDIVNSDLSEGEKIQKFLTELQGVGAETFVAIELANGSWQERLKRLHGTVLGFEKIGSHMSDVLKDRVVWRFNKILSDQMGSRQLSLSNLRDASALAVLHGMIGERNLGNDVPIVRFYTDTDRLIYAWSTNEKMRNDLSYSGKSAGDFQRDKDFIYRDTDYFILRASFEALRFRGVDRKGRHVSVALTELDRVSRELDKALVDPSIDLIEKVEQIMVCDRMLMDVIAEIETLSFLRSVWSQYKPPKALKSMIHGLAEVWAFADDQMTQGRLHSEIRRDVDILKRELGEKVSHLRGWFTMFREVQSKASGLRGRFDEHEIPNPMRDLGMVRWGFALSAETSERIQDYFEVLASPDDDEWVRGCADFVSEIEGVDDDNSCAVSCAILWLLTLFERLVEVINDYEDMMGMALSPGFILMRNAARLRTTGSFSRIEKEKQMEDLASLVRDFSGVERGRLLIGLGYNCFYMWYSERNRYPTSESSDDTKEVALSWAMRSFLFGEEAVKLLKKDEPLGYAFAINHCAFVGVLTGVEPDLTRTYLDRLAEIRGEKDAWHYRFADTLAYSDYLEAEKLWETIKGEESHRDVQRLRKRACKMLESAEKFLGEAGPYYNDPEIPQHQIQVERLKRNINCPD